MVKFQPLYKQIKDAIYERIVDGIYKPGIPLPTEPNLAKEFNTSIAPIRQAVSTLEAEGVLRKHQGKGTFVAENKTKLSLLTHFSEYPVVFEMINDLLRHFENENPLIEIEHSTIEPAKARDHLLSLIANGNPPDIIHIIEFWTSYFSSMGAFTPLDALLKDNYSKVHIKAADYQNGIYQDKLYTLAWGLSPFTHFGHKKRLEELGIEIDPESMTIREFSEICNIISAEYKNNSDMYTYSLTITGGYSDFLTIYVYLQAFGGGFTNTKEEIIFNSKENVAAFSWLRQFIMDNKVLLTDIEPGRRALAEGAVVFKTEGPYLKYTLEEISREPFENNFILFLNPVLKKGNPSLSWNNNTAFAVSSQSENKLYAAKLIEFLTHDKKANPVFEKLGYLPVDKSSFSEPEFQNGFYANYKKQLEHSTVINAHHYLFEQAMDLCSDSVRKILFTDIDIEKELDEKEYYLNMLYKKKKFI